MGLFGVLCVRFNAHINTLYKCIMATYECISCNFLSENKKDYNRHILTKKHINTNLCKKTISDIRHKFACDKCTSSFLTKNALFDHYNSCVNYDSENGIIYLIQPKELLKTCRYKIGCSKKHSLDRCKNGYKSGKGI